MEQLATWNQCAVYLHHGDITTLEVDVIVNAANNELLAGGGVCGAIHRRAGQSLSVECAAILERRGPIPTGQAVITGAGTLPAKQVIHAVGPFYDDDTEAAPRLLAAAYTNSLALVRDRGLKSIAFPCISTGTFGYPQEEACRVAVAGVRKDLEEAGKLEKVIFCTFAIGDAELYRLEVSQ